MKKFTYALLVFLVSSLGFSSKSFSSHYAAADLTYTCLGGNQYLITLTFFRDCSGISASTTATVSFQSSCGNLTATLPMIGTGVEVTPTCPSAATTCSGGTLYGLQRYIYQGQVTIPPCNNWAISWEDCCRNPSNTLLNATSQNWYLPAGLNNSAAPCNSSPYFSNMPATVICMNQYFCYNHGAIDPDGDSLVYSLVAPFQGAGTIVNYQGGYNALNPLPSNPPVSIDPLTGDICMNPTTAIIAVLGVRVEEWRRINGVPVMIGYILRDMQVNVIACNNLLPDLSGINPNATAYDPNDTIYAIEVCLGETVDFDIFPYDASIPDQNLTMSWNNGIPGAFWIVVGNGTPNPVGNFIWYPTAADAGNIPHCFTVNVKDNNCPYIGQQTKSYCITVKSNFLTLDPPNDTILCLGETYNLTAHSASTVINYNWFVDSVYTPTPVDTVFVVNAATLGVGTHTIACYDGAINECPGSNSVTVTVMPDLTITATAQPPGICAGESSTLSASGAFTYVWLPGNVNGDTLTVTPPSTTTYTVTGTGNYGCSGSADVTVSVTIVNSVAAFANPKIICTGEDTQLNATGATTFIWVPDSIAGSTITVSPDATTLFTVYGEVNGCYDSDTVTVMVFDNPDVSFMADVYKGCEDLLVRFTDMSNFPDATWYWDFGDYSFSYDQNPEHLYIDDGVYDVSLTITSPYGCSNTYTWPGMITVYKAPYAFFTPVPSQAEELNPTFWFQDQSIGANEWNWYFGDPNALNNNSNLQHPVHTYSDTGNYTVMLAVITEHGCVDTFRYVISVIPSVTFYIPNAFTLNGDGKNEGFRGLGTGINEATYEIHIFNRWGEEVFRSYDLYELWDGRDGRRGKTCPQGLYTWLVAFSDVFDKDHTLRGTVVMIK